MLDQFERAYAARDAAAVRRIWPSAPSNLADALASTRSYSVNIVNPQIGIKGDAATVTATRSLRIQPAAGAVQQRSQPTTFTMRRGPNGWFIEDVR